ncbi:hypothetical protein [uncultured Sphingopyxis sp.]|nr:hypothetical protein [uncultured Sphingopyxis sp.]
MNYFMPTAWRSSRYCSFVADTARMVVFGAGYRVRNHLAIPARLALGVSPRVCGRKERSEEGRGRGKRKEEEGRGGEQRSPGSRFANVKEGRSERTLSADAFADVGRFIDAGHDHQPVMGLCWQLPEHADMVKMASRNRRRLRKLEQAMLLMAPRDQAIFRGHFIDNAPFTELADWHGISIAEVEAALCRGLEILADVLEPNPRRWWRFWRR